ncbi:isoprenyl transferase [Anaerosporobacter faecicola]|uniref:isoprenyl transferase n=1 Tax=Anaerosporobacter faecicola TaxID=2718714 RepID=UPI00143AD956|nr:isoprenyl transferase [Anaerosporobacter faecicola]
MANKNDLEGLQIPEHIAIILDGNGRWAKKRMMPRNYGHVQGSKNVERICRAAYNMGVKYLTVYAFSTENWSRPEDEVETIMKLLNNYLKDCIKLTTKNNMKVRVIGNISRLDESMQKRIRELEEISASNTGLNLQVALNYGSRDEILRAMKRMMVDYDKKAISLDEIDETLFSEYLDTKDIPDPDLLIRTSGEQRLSNYLLWQMAYTEFYFTNVLWPDFSEKDLEDAVRYYNSKERRFGGLTNG